MAGLSAESNERGWHCTDLVMNATGGTVDVGKRLAWVRVFFEPGTNMLGCECTWKDAARVNTFKYE